MPPRPARSPNHAALARSVTCLVPCRLQHRLAKGPLKLQQPCAQVSAGGQRVCVRTPLQRIAPFRLSLPGPRTRHDVRLAVPLCPQQRVRRLKKWAAAVGSHQVDGSSGSLRAAWEGRFELRRRQASAGGGGVRDVRLLWADQLYMSRAHTCSSSDCVLTPASSSFWVTSVSANSTCSPSSGCKARRGCGFEGWVGRAPQRCCAATCSSDSWRRAQHPAGRPRCSSAPSGPRAACSSGSAGSAEGGKQGFDGRRARGKKRDAHARARPPCCCCCRSSPAPASRAWTFLHLRCRPAPAPGKGSNRRGGREPGVCAGACARTRRRTPRPNRPHRPRRASSLALALARASSVPGGACARLPLPLGLPITADVARPCRAPRLLVLLLLPLR